LVAEARAVAQGENKGFMVCKTKMGTSAEQLCRAVSEPFRIFTDAVISLSFEEEPAYGALRALFEPLLGGAASRPIAIDTGAVKARAPSLLMSTDVNRLFTQASCSYRQGPYVDAPTYDQACHG